MQCRDFEVRMQALLDERQAPQCDAQLQAHARECQSCRQILAVQEALFRGMGRRHSAPAPVGFASRVLLQVEASVVTRPSVTAKRPWLLAAAVLTAAAAALIALSITLNSQPPNHERVNVAGSQEDRQPASVKPSAVGLAANAEHAKEFDRKPTAHRASEGDDAVAKSGSSLAAADVESLEQYGQALQSLASQVPQAVERLDEVEEATPGLRSVRSSFTLAIGTIRRTIPPQRKHQDAPKPGKRDSGWLWLSASEPA